ncbi:hypothetical protein HOG98_05795 [bacterium]|jgi:beta-mannanase|nr:hypothetical protein [bacterium]
MRTEKKSKTAIGHHLRSYLLLSFFSVFALFVFSGCFPETTSDEEGRVYLGVSQKHVPRDISPYKNYDKKVSISSWHLDWEQKFPKDRISELLKKGVVSHIVWEPWIWNDSEALKLKAIIKGDWDEYIKEWAVQVAKLEYPIFIDFAPNFNNQDIPWSVFQNYKRPKSYKNAYRRVVDIFREEGAINAIWVWSYSNQNSPETRWNNPNKAYPGDDYVDWIGVTGYNRGDINNHHWESFEDLFKQGVKQAKLRYSSKPVMISEVGTVKNGGDKSEWFSSIPLYLNSTLKDVKCIIYADYSDDIYNWKIDSTPSAELAFNTLIKDPIFQSSVDDINDVKPRQFKESKIQISNLGKTKSNEAVTIDGNYGEWEQVSPHLIDKIGNIYNGAEFWTDSSDSLLNIKLAGNEEKLYLYAEYKDDDLVIGTAKDRHQDKILVYFSWETDDGNYEVKSIVLKFGHKVRNARTGKNIKDAEIVHTTQKNRTRLEAEIPWESLTYSFSSGKELGLNIGYYDYEKSGSSRHILFGNHYFKDYPHKWPRVNFN